MEAMDQGSSTWREMPHGCTPDDSTLFRSHGPSVPIANECRCHFQAKFDDDFWPIRPTNRHGQPKPISGVWDAGRNVTQLLWEIEKVRLDTIRAIPKRAWPIGCEHAPTVRFCESKDCIFHMERKLRGAHRRGHWTARDTAKETEELPQYPAQHSENANRTNSG
ncbi:hypothetical protein VTK56DRAFT_194 [Thermocarpiscus australiensis]